MTAPPLLPVTDDPDTGEFFAAAGRGALAVCECAGCGRSLHMPRRWCHHCRAGEVRWREVAPAGTVYSYCVVAHQVHPDYPVPYTVLLIELDEAPGVRLVGHVDGRPGLAIGDPVRARFAPAGDGGLPVWELAQPPDHRQA